MKLYPKTVQLFAHLDFFQQNVILKLNGNYAVSLLPGKLFSIGIIMFLVYNFLESNMINKINPNVIQQSYTDSEIPEILLTNENFEYSTFF